MTIREMRDELQATLSAVVDEGEARAMAIAIIEDVKGYTPTQMIMYSERTLLDQTVSRIRGMAQRILKGEPMQYVTGIARFRGRDFMVDPSVLIPRPETGQLVDMIIDENRGRKDARVLDIGSGSGCIAISLALDLPYSEVYAIDISPAAVQTTLANAQKLKARINASQADIYATKGTQIDRLDFDIIVSNPPYILESEALTMDARVKDHEPRQALFVEDAQPIAIYEAIAEFASTHLKPGGRLYLEINPLCADAIKEMLTSYGLDRVETLLDYKGNVRFATASKR